MNIAVIFGTFNPISKAHINMGKKMIDSFDAEKVIYVPAKEKYIDTKAKQTTRKLMFSEQERIALIKKAFESAPAYNYAFVCSDIEISQETQQYSYNTLKKIKEIYGDQNYFLVFGDDKLEELKFWNNVESLLEENKIVIIRRQMLSLSDVKEFIKKDKVLKDYENNIFIMDGDKENISSTSIRDDLSVLDDIIVSLKRKMDSESLKSIIALKLEGV